MTIIDRLKAAWHERAVALKALSFAAVGVVNTAVDFALFLAFYNLLGLPLIPANISSWIIAVSGSYVMNSFTTFAAESGRQLRLKSYASFVVSGIAGVVANTATLVVASYFVPVLVAKLIAIAVSFLINFSLSHFVVFRTRKPADGERQNSGGAPV